MEDWIPVGSDELSQQGQTIRIRSACSMPTWRFSAHRPAVVFYEGQRYQVVQASPTSDQRFEYTLEPLADGPHQFPSITVEYGPDFVEERDSVALETVRRSRQAPLLWLAGPLIGFLPSRTKLRLEALYGVDPVRVTGKSLLLEYFLGLGLIFGSVFSPAPGLSFLLAALLLADGMMRYSAYSMSQREQWGLLEWLLRMRLYPEKSASPLKRQSGPSAPGRQGPY